MTRCRAQFVSRTLRAFATLFSLILILAGCGGGPTVATPTGRFLYVSTTSGIYGFSIMSDGSLESMSTKALVTGSYLQIAATPGTPSGQTSPLLLGASNSTSLSAWSISGSGTLTTITLPGLTSCSMSITGVAVTLDNNYALALNGGASSSNLESIPLAGGTCASMSTISTTYYPIQAAFDCSDPSLPSTSCDVLITLSTKATTSSFTPTDPEEDVYTESGTISASTTTFSGCSNCPLGTAFNNTTLFFYNTFNTTPALQSLAPKTTTMSSQASFSSSNLELPCVDSIGGVAYVTTSNGYLYSVSTGASGSLGDVTTVLSPSTFGSALSMTSCTVVTNP